MIDKSTVETQLSIKMILIKTVSNVYSKHIEPSVPPLSLIRHWQRKYIRSGCIQMSILWALIHRIQVPCYKLYYSHRLCCGRMHAMGLWNVKQINKWNSILRHNVETKISNGCRLQRCRNTAPAAAATAAPISHNLGVYRLLVGRTWRHNGMGCNACGPPPRHKLTHHFIIVWHKPHCADDYFYLFPIKYKVKWHWYEMCCAARYTHFLSNVIWMSRLNRLLSSIDCSPTPASDACACAYFWLALFSGIAASPCRRQYVPLEATEEKESFCNLSFFSAGRWTYFASSFFIVEITIPIAGPKEFRHSIYGRNEKSW